MLRFFFKHFHISDKRLRMWCIEQVSNMGYTDTQYLCQKAEELYNYIKDGVPYQADWLNPEK